MERIRGTVHDIQVVNRGSIKYMRFGSRGGWQGALDNSRPSRPVFPYQRAFVALLPVFRRKDKHRFLSFGVGTGTSLRSVQAVFPEAELFGVELDEHVLDTAIRHFSAPTHTNAEYFVGDGLEYLSRTQDTFSLMFVDAYMSNRIYSPCLEPTVPKLIFHSLDGSGVALFNFITQLPPVEAMEVWLQAAKHYFPSIYLLPVGLPFTEQNTLVVASTDILAIEDLRQALRSSPYLSTWEKITWPLRVTSI
jgi:spermidine synthase